MRPCKRRVLEKLDEKPNKQVGIINSTPTKKRLRIIKVIRVE